MGGKGGKGKGRGTFSYAIPASRIALLALYAAAALVYSSAAFSRLSVFELNQNLMEEPRTLEWAFSAWAINCTGSWAMM